jgi:flavin-dependent dehydrogenase
LSSEIKRIIVLGGGTAGWITAGLLAKKHAGGVKVTLIESPDISTIGVGEGTWPTMRQTLSKLGVSETTFLRKCNATFKQASKFVNWISPQNDVYYHPFSEPQGFNKVDLSPYWQEVTEGECSFSEAATFQHYLCENGLAPKTIANKQYEAVANYGYHLDAGQFIELLREHCTTELKVELISDTVTRVLMSENGDIRSLVTNNNGELNAELYVDCSGMRSKLLGESLNVPFLACDDIFFSDTALATQIPYADIHSPIPSCTISTAQDAGWIWDIGLQHRRGVGYVYSSQFSTQEQAYDTLAQYLGDESLIENVKKINFTPGHREIFWKNNCVAVGLSAGFLEPLEASALMLVETSANFIAEQLPANTQQMQMVAKRFNASMLMKWRGVIDFLKLHYVLSKRDTPFWVKNRHPSSVPDTLKELLELWRFRSPSEYDFTDNMEAFSAASYQYILYGAGFRTDFSSTEYLYNKSALATKQIMLNRQRLEQLKYSLPRHRELLEKVNQVGFSAI